MKINKHPKFQIMMKDGKEMLLFFKSTKIREDEVSDQLVRDFENKKYEVDLNDSNCKEDFEQRIIDIDINDSKKYYVLGSFKIIPENIEIQKILEMAHKKLLVTLREIK